MDLALPPMPFSTVFVPDASGNSILRIPEEMRNTGLGSPPTIIELPVGVVQVIVTWKGVEPISIRHFTGNTSTYENIATIPASSTVEDRSTGVLTLASDKRHGIMLFRGGGNWNATTLSNGYVAGVQIMPMGTAADITGGGSMLRVDNSVGTRVFLGDTMIYGDTGWRSVPLMENWTGVCRIRRVGSFVEARLEDVRKVDTSISGANVVTLPVGWRLTNPASLPSIHRVPFVIHNNGSGDNYAYIAANGVYLRVTDSSGNPGNAIIGYTVDQSWPDSLPGTAA